MVPNIHWSLWVLAFTSLGVSSATNLPRGLTTDPVEFSAQSYDYIVVGGGTAGLTVAARLAETSSVKVGVIEAGPYLPNDPIINVPKNFGIAPGNAAYDWIYQTVPQVNSNNKNVRQPRGKVLGGSSAINFLIFNRASSTEYNAWSILGNGSGWSWSSLLPYFKKSETYTPPPPSVVFPQYPGTTAASLAAVGDDIPVAALEDESVPTEELVSDEAIAAASEAEETPALRKRQTSQYHGSNGPIKASHNSWYSDLAWPFIEVLNGLGIRTNRNPGSGNNVGIYNSPASVDRVNGVRSYSASTYYANNAAKTNFVVLTGAQATKINFASSLDSQGNRVATSVQFYAGGQYLTVNATKEIILSTGVFGTPALLELSGVGNPAILQNLGITPLVNLTGVGENLQDHAMVSSVFSLKPGNINWDDLRNNATFAAEQQARYAATKDGLYASTIGTLAFFPLRSFLTKAQINSLKANLASELLNAASSISPLSAAQYVIQGAWLEDRSVPQLEIVYIPGYVGSISPPAAGTNYITIAAVLQHPFSRGSVHITTANPLDKPAVDPKYFSRTFDKDVLVKGAQFVRKIAQSAPLADSIADMLDPSSSVQSDADFENYSKNALESLKHPVGTAAMAPRILGGVVDNRLRVYGTKGLRVVDASIFPLHISAHPQATTYAIGELAADLIKQDA